MIRFICKIYFLGCVAGSFTHLMSAADKLGAQHLWERLAFPVSIDLMFIIAMDLRSAKHSTDTRRLGFKLMLSMGSVSLAGNVYAGFPVAFGLIFGAMLPSLLLLAEWLVTRIKTAKQEQAEIKAAEQAAAIADAERIAAAEAQRLAAEAAAAQQAAAAANAWRALCSHPTPCGSEAQCQTKTEAANKRSKTVARQKRQRTAQERALESLVNA